MEKKTTWAAFGALAINLVLGCLVALIFSAAPAVQAAEAPQSSSKAPSPPPKQEAKKVDHLTAVRMGWAAG